MNGEKRKEEDSGETFNYRPVEIANKDSTLSPRYIYENERKKMNE